MGAWIGYTCALYYYTIRWGGNAGQFIDKINSIEGIEGINNIEGIQANADVDLPGGIPNCLMNIHNVTPKGTAAIGLPRCVMRLTL